VTFSGTGCSWIFARVEIQISPERAALWWKLLGACTHAANSRPDCLLKRSVNCYYCQYSVMFVSLLLICSYCSDVRCLQLLVCWSACTTTLIISDKWTQWTLAYIGLMFYHAKLRVVARYCQVCPSVCQSLCDVEVSWSNRLEFCENNFTADKPNLFDLRKPQHEGSTPKGTPQILAGIGVG